MMEYLRRSYREGTQISPLNAFVGAVIGAPAHALFYVIFKYGFELAEDLVVRVIATLLCVSLYFMDRFPPLLRKHIAVYWHTVVIFVLPFTFTYHLLLTNFHELWRYWELFMVFVMILYVPNLVAFLLDLTIGMLAATAAFFAFNPDVQLSLDFNAPLYAIVLLFTTLAGQLFSANNLQGALAQEKVRALRSLAGGIAHEMRNPLGQVKHSLDAIGHRLPGQATGRERSCVDKATLNQLYQLVAQGQIAVTRGVQVIDMILNEVHDKPIDSQQFAYLSALHVTTKALDEYGYDNPAEREWVSLEAHDDFTFRGDETLFVFVLFNLLKNALYYLPSHPHARITLELETAGERHLIRFRDTGPGIPADRLPHLFDGFYTLGKKGGTGLGLAYCKRVMTAFGGDIVCASELGEYTEFTLSFPAVPDSAMETELNALLAEVAPRFADTRILVVDDDRLQRDLVRRHLAELAVSIDEAETGNEAVQLSARTRYDLILMDLNMPAMNGYEATRMILATAAMDAVPRIVAHTSEPAYIARSKVENAGMLALIGKPCGQLELIRQLAAVLDLPAWAPQGAAGADHDVDLTLLLVDDSRSMRETLAMRYEMEGFDVIEAGSGAEALSRLQSVRCDAVLTDISMPGMDGYQLAQRIRALPDPTLSGLPVIGLSGHKDAIYQELALASGMDDFVTKTDDFETVLAAIRRAVQARPAAAVPVVDLHAAARQLGLPDTALQEQLGRFVTEYQVFPARIEAAFAQQDLDTVGRLAHQLKGCQLLHAQPTASAAQHLEALVKDPQAVASQQHQAMSELTLSLEKLLAELTRLDAQRATIKDS